MTLRVTLLCHSSTAATNAARFPADEPLDERGAGLATAARGLLPRAARVAVSPALCARQTADALGLAGRTDPELADWDLGRWSGRTLDEVAATEPAGATAWFTDPDAAPHGGEPLAALLARTAAWLDAVPGDGHTVAVTHPAVVRAAVVVVLGAPPEGFWRVDVAPMTATVLRGRPGRLTLRTTGERLAPRSAPATPGESE